MVDLTALARANADRWARAKVTRNLAGIARSLVAAKPRYQAVEKATGVPWWAIAVIHERESSQDWGASLAQGDPWNAVSTHVPKGRGPFTSWEAAAIDALTKCEPYLARKKDWTVGAALTNLELYNGPGYASRGRPSPYLWAGTDQYVIGKYTSDGSYNPSKVDAQPGCAALLKLMMQMDPTIKFQSSVTTKAAGSVAAGSAAATAAHQAGLSVGWIIAIGVAAAVAAFAIWRFKK